MTTIEAVILGLLFENDYYGYEIEKIIKDRGMREWTDIGFSSIYSILAKAEKSGLIEWRYEKQYGSPKRKVYSLTEIAREVLPGEVGRMLSTPKRSFNEFDVGMAYSNLIEEKSFSNHLLHYRGTLEDRLNKLREKYEEGGKDGMPHNVKALFSRHIALITAELAWLNEEFDI
jgi:PadR family transcriptional regulator, regulatory protein PadR